MAEEGIEVQITADVDNLSSGLEEAGSKVEETGKEMEEAFGNIGESLEEIKEKFQTAFEVTGAAIAYEAVEKLVESMEELAEKAEHLEQTAFLYDTNTAALQGLYHAATEAGVGTETMDRGLRTLTMRLQAAREGSTQMQEKLEAVGITMGDLQNPTFGAAEAMETMAKTESTHAEQMAVLGPRAIMVALAFEKMKGGIEGASAAAEKNGALNEQEIATLSEYHSKVALLGEAYNNLKMRIAAELVPSIEVLIDGFKELFSSMAGGQTVGDALIKVFQMLVNTVVQVVGYVKFSADAIVGAFEIIGKAVGGLAAMVANPIDNFGTMKIVFADLKDSVSKNAAQMDKDLLITTQTVNQLGMAFDGLNEIKVTAKKLPEDIGVIDVKDKTKKKQEEDPQLKELGIELEEAKKGSEEKIALAEQYATRSAEVYKGDVDKALDAYKKVLDATKAFNAQKLADAETNLKDLKSVQDKGIDDALKDLQQANKDKKLSNDDLLKDEIDLYNAKLAVDDEYYKNLEALDMDDTKKLEKDLQDQLSNTQKITQQIQQAQTKAAEETQKEWDKITKPIENSFSGMVQNIVKGTETLKTGLKKEMDSIVTDVFKTNIDKMTHQWTQGLEQQLMATKTKNAEKNASDQVAAQTSTTINAQQATKEIQTNAITSAAGAYKAMVSIPYVGPLLAIAAMAAAEALVMGLIGKIASAEGGMVVDHDQLAMVHEDEMILPSHISQGINERILNAPPPEQGASANHYNINSMDAKSFEKFLGSQGNRNIVAKTLKQASQRGNRNVRGR